MIDKEKLKRRFSRNANQYDKYAKVQKKMGDVLIEKIKSTKCRYKNILEIGCGTGYVTTALFELFKDSNITAVDIAPGMINHVKSKLLDKRVEFICADAEEMDFDKKYDLIISNATFQWFNNLENTLKKLADTLAPGGFMFFSTFGKNTFTELKKCYQKASVYFGIKDTIYSSQPFLSLEDYKKICSSIFNEKFTLSFMETYEYEYFNCCKDFLYSIKKIGANNSQKNIIKVPLDFIDKVIDIYDKDFKKDGKVAATYHSLFVFISKNAV